MQWTLKHKNGLDQSVHAQVANYVLANYFFFMLNVISKMTSIAYALAMFMHAAVGELAAVAALQWQDMDYFAL